MTEEIEFQSSKLISNPSKGGYVIAITSHNLVTLKVLIAGRLELLKTSVLTIIGTDKYRKATFLKRK